MEFAMMKEESFDERCAKVPDVQKNDIAGNTRNLEKDRCSRSTSRLYKGLDHTVHAHEYSFSSDV